MCLGNPFVHCYGGPIDGQVVVAEGRRLNVPVVTNEVAYPWEIGQITYTRASYCLPDGHVAPIYVLPSELRHINRTRVIADHPPS